MATLLQLGASGQLDMNTVADKINSAANLSSMNTRISGGAAPYVFPDDYYGFDYLKFTSVVPWTVTALAQGLTVGFLCYGTPVVTTDAPSWITGIDTHGEINGTGQNIVAIGKNTGAQRVGNITITVTQPLGTYVITTSVTQQAAISTTPVTLGYSATDGDPTACNNFVFSPATYYVPTGFDFSTATELFDADVGYSYAAPGYYSDGSNWRFWGGTLFSGSGSCTL